MVDTSKTYLLIHKQTNKALQAYGNDGTYTKDLQIGPINQNNQNQLWIMQLKDKNKYQVILGMPNLVLTASGSDLSIKKSIADKSHQIWQIYDNNNGFLIKQNKHDNCYLGTNNHKITVKKITSNEKIDLWQLREVTKNNQLNRCSYIQCTRTNKLMDVPSSQQTSGARISILQANHRFSQRWKIYKAGDVFIIKNYKTDLNLDIQDSSYQQNTKIIQYHSTGTHHQFWQLQQKKSGGYYRICSWYNPIFQLANDGKYLVLNKGEKYIWKIDGHVPGA